MIVTMVRAKQQLKIECCSERFFLFNYLGLYNVNVSIPKQIPIVYPMIQSFFFHITIMVNSFFIFAIHN